MTYDMDGNPDFNLGYKKGFIAGQEQHDCIQGNKPYYETGFEAGKAAAVKEILEKFPSFKSCEHALYTTPCITVGCLVGEYNRTVDQIRSLLDHPTPAYDKQNAVIEKNIDQLHDQMDAAPAPEKCCECPVPQTAGSLTCISCGKRPCHSKEK